MNKKKIYQELKEFLTTQSRFDKYIEISDDTLKRFLNLSHKKNFTEKHKIYKKEDSVIFYSESHFPNTTQVDTTSFEEINFENEFSGIDKNWKNASDLESLNNAIKNCTSCRLHKTRTNFVFGEGNPNAELMFIGEGPGRDEDLQGRPFVGRAGQLLDKMIAAMTYRREEVYIANVVKCRPPDNRVPEADEASCCLPFLYKQIEFITPKIIILLGATPVKYILNVKTITEVRGKWHKLEEIKIMPTYHPAYLLRNPSAKKVVWEDLKLVMKELGRKIPI